MQSIFLLNRDDGQEMDDLMEWTLMDKGWTILCDSMVDELDDLDELDIAD